MRSWSGGVIGPAFWALWAALFSLLLIVEPAFAAGRQARSNRRSQEKAARKACLTGDYTSGVAILADLFIEYRDPTYVFNQGRCLEQSSRYKEAIARFEEYLRISADPADQAAAQKHIEDCKAKLPDEDRAQAVAPQPMVQPIPPAAPTAQIVEKPKGEPEPPKTGKRLLIAGIVTGGVGAAAVIAGVAFNVKANGLVDEMEGKVDAYTSSKNSSQQTYQTLAWVGYGVGAACIATGAVLTVVGASRRGSSARTDVALVPALGPGRAGVLLRGGF
jgi:tetratricopeptide (TPR) repeat protein